MGRTPKGKRPAPGGVAKVPLPPIRKAAKKKKKASAPKTTAAGTPSAAAPAAAAAGAAAGGGGMDGAKLESVAQLIATLTRKADAFDAARDAAEADAAAAARRAGAGKKKPRKAAAARPRRRAAAAVAVEPEVEMEVEGEGEGGGGGGALGAATADASSSDASDSDTGGSGSSSSEDGAGSDVSDGDGAAPSDSDVDEEEQHRAQLRELEKDDPAFFAYLRENEPELLDFGEATPAADGDETSPADGDSDVELSSSDEEPSDDEEAAADAQVVGAAADDEAEDGGGAADGEAADGDQMVTAERVARWNAALDAGTVGERTVRVMVRAFRAGCELTHGSDAGGGGGGGGPAGGRGGGGGGGGSVGKPPAADETMVAADGSFGAAGVRFASARVFRSVMTLGAVRLHDVLDGMLGRADASAAGLAAFYPERSGRWPKLRALAKAYAMTYLGLLAAVRDAPTSRVLLRHAPRLAPYAAVEASIGHRLGRLVVDAWASSAVSAATRLRAYLTLRAIILARPATFFTPLLKLCVAAYRRRVGARNSPRALPRISFAVRSVVELTALDVAAAYTLAFGGIRDLAVTLRGALTSADKVAGRLPVLSWPFLNSLRLWAAVLCAAPDAAAGLGALVYPFVQVCLGAMGLAVTPRTFPVRFHIAGWLADVQAASGAYVPLAPPLLEVLQCAELRKARSALPTPGPRKGGGGGGGGGKGGRRPPPAPPTAPDRPIDWRTTARVSDAGVRMAGFRSGLVRRSLLLLGRHAACQASHVAFPELVAPTVGALKRFASTTRVPEFRADVAGLVDALTATASAVAAARSAVPFGPRDAAAVCGKPGAAGMQRAVLDSLTAGGRTTPVEGWYQVEQERLAKEDALRDAGMDGSDADDEAGGAGGEPMGADSTDDDGDDDSDDDDDDDDSDGGGGEQAGAAAAREARAAKKAAAKERKAAKTAAARTAAVRAMQRPVRLSAPGVEEDTVDTLVLSDSDTGAE